MLEVTTETVISGKEHLVGILGNGRSMAVCLITKAPPALIFERARIGYLTSFVLCSFYKCAPALLLHFKDVPQNCNFRFFKGNFTVPPIAGLA